MAQKIMIQVSHEDLDKAVAARKNENYHGCLDCLIAHTVRRTLGVAREDVCCGLSTITIGDKDYKISQRGVEMVFKYCNDNHSEIEFGTVVLTPQ